MSRAKELQKEWLADTSRKRKEIVTKASTKEYRDNWDRIFSKNSKSEENVSGIGDNQKPTE